MVLLKFQVGIVFGWGIQFCIQSVPTYFWWTLLHEKWEILEKMWCRHQHPFFSCISHFLWSGIHQKYAKWVLVGCRTEFPIQWILPLKILVKPHGEKLKKNFFFTLHFFTFLPSYSKNGDSSPMVDIITLNTIGSYKVDFYCTFLFWGPFFTSKIL